MSETDRTKWDSRYRTRDYEPGREPSRFLEECIPMIGGGQAAVLACGAGRNALRLAEAGFRVDGFDISAVAIAMANNEADRRGLDVNLVVADLDEAPLGSGSYDLITAIRYTNRSTWSRSVDALAANGWLLMETHLQTTLTATGPSPGPFRVEPNELLDAFDALRIIHYSETVEPSSRHSGEVSVLARLLACNGEPGW